MTKSVLAAGFAFVVITLVGCSAAAPEDDKPVNTVKSRDGGASTPPPPTATTTSPTEPTACVPEGTKGNSLGVGAFCSKTVACASGLLCTAAYAPVGAQFCTIVCSTDADCGEDSTCYHEARGSGCTPNACLKK